MAKGWAGPLEVRFWNKVQMGNECWEWQGCRQGHGYGQIRIDGKAMLAHRVSWEMAFGTIPDGMCVLHKCDNPACIKPAHLFLGTFADNISDMYAKGRGNPASGGDNVWAKLTPADVHTIRSSELSSRKLAVEFGVSHTTILAVKRGERYKEID